jgi:hypothetical protein
MAPKYQRKTSVKNIDKNRELLRIRRDLAFHLYTSAHDMWEAYSWRESETMDFLKSLESIQRQLDDVRRNTHEKLEKQRQNTADALRLFQQVDRVHGALDRVANEAGLPEVVSVDFEEIIERISLTHGLAKETSFFAPSQPSRKKGSAA